MKGESSFYTTFALLLPSFVNQKGEKNSKMPLLLPCFFFYPSRQGSSTINAGNNFHTKKGDLTQEKEKLFIKSKKYHSSRIQTLFIIEKIKTKSPKRSDSKNIANLKT